MEECVSFLPYTFPVQFEFSSYVHIRIAQCLKVQPLIPVCRNLNCSTNKVCQLPFCATVSTTVKWG